MALASARPDCLVLSSGADYKAWSGAGQNCNLFVRSAASQQLASHKSVVSQPLIRSWLATNWCSVNSLGWITVLIKHLSISIKKPNLSKKMSFTTYKLAGLDIARPGPDQTINCHEICPHRFFRFTQTKQPIKTTLYLHKLSSWS